MTPQDLFPSVLLHPGRMSALSGNSSLHSLPVYKGQNKQKIYAKIVNIFLSISFNICFGCSIEPPH